VLLADLLWEKNIDRWLKKVRLISQANRAMIHTFFLFGLGISMWPFGWYLLVGWLVENNAIARRLCLHVRVDSRVSDEPEHSISVRCDWSTVWNSQWAHEKRWNRRWWTGWKAICSVMVPNTRKGYDSGVVHLALPDCLVPYSDERWIT